MKIQEAFEKSYNQLFKNKELILPFILIYLFAGIIFGIFFIASGAHELFQELYGLQTQYQQNLLQGNQEYFIDLETREDFLSKTNYDLAGKMFSVLNKQNLILFIITILLITAVSFYFITASRAATSLVIKKKKISIKNVTELTHKLFFRNLWLNVLVAVIVFIPVLAFVTFGIIGAYIAFVDPFFILLFFLLLPIVLIIFTYLTIKLFFSEAILFLEQKTAMNSIKQSFTISKGKKLNIFLLILFVWGVQVVFSIISPPLSGDLLFYTSVISYLKTLLITIIVLLLQGIFSAFTLLFIFNSYLEFKKMR